MHLEGTLPNGAVIGGWERDRPTYVARARHEGHWEVGKLNAWARIGYSYLGKEFESAKGEILVATSGQVIPDPSRRTILLNKWNL